MSLHRIAIILLFSLLLALPMLRPINSTAPVMAQGDDDEDSLNQQCEALVIDALRQIGSNCRELGRNEACYGNAQIEADLVRSGLRFENAGDIISIDALSRLQTYSADPATGDYGVALLDILADLPEASSEHVRLVLFGGGSLALEDDTDAVQAFSFAIDDSGTCSDAPSGLLVQSPTGSTANLMVNDVSLQIGSTAFLSMDEQQLIIGNYDGHVRVFADGRWRDVPRGRETRVNLRDGRADSIPFRTRPFSERSLNMRGELLALLRTPIDLEDLRDASRRPLQGEAQNDTPNTDQQDTRRESRD